MTPTLLAAYLKAQPQDAFVRQTEALPRLAEGMSECPPPRPYPRRERPIERRRDADVSGIAHRKLTEFQSIGVPNPLSRNPDFGNFCPFETKPASPAYPEPTESAVEVFRRSEPPR
jgi:hypothetical protein